MKEHNPIRIKVNYVKWERNDAIGKVSSKVLENLRGKVDLNIITLKRGSRNELLKFFKSIKNTMKILQLFFRNEIIHFEAPTDEEIILNIIFKHKKSILTVHHLEENNLRFVIERLFLLRNEQKYISFSKLIAVSEKTKIDLIKEYKISPNKIKTIYSGVDKKIFRPVNKSLRKINNKYILYLGSEVPRKNIENLLKAFKIISQKYPELILLKAGYSGGEKYRKNTERLIKELDLTDKVVIISKHLKEEELPVYYSNAELFLYPSLKEGFGMPLVEAMSCGCPIVTSNISPMKDIANEQELIHPSDYKDIAKGINKVLSNKSYKERLKKKALERAKDFDWERSAREIVEVYKELENKN